jgi:hypothetical protein
MQAHGAVDLMRHDDLLPGNHIRWCLGDQQRASTVGQVFMRGEERLDPARTGHAEAVDVDLPTNACVADQGDRNGGATELFDGGSHRASFACRAGEELGKVVTVA